MADLASGSYVPRLENVDVVKLLEARSSRYPLRTIKVTPPADATAATLSESLRLDPLLLSIIVDNLLSNSLKYGNKTAELRFEISAESLEQKGYCSVQIMLHNTAGQGHARLLEIGEEELNRVAAAEGGRVEQTTPKTDAESWGEGFPMALACARKLGGTLQLSLSETGVTTTLMLPKTRVGAEISEMDLGRIARLSFAVVDDSALNRKMLVRVASSLFSAARTPPIIAGSTRESIENFAVDVAQANTDILFIDQNFGTVAPAMSGTDVISQIRRHDEDTNARPRFIFAVSANDSKDDRALYAYAGADDCLSKNNVTLSSMTEFLRKHLSESSERVAANP